MNIETSRPKSTAKSNTYIDETIVSTPQPQASSTVDRKSTANDKRRRRIENHGSDRNTAKYSLDHVPVKDMDSVCSKSNISNLSSQSSLGILPIESMEDIKDVLSENEQKRDSDVSDAPSGGVAEKLKMQRLLAQKALERAGCKGKPSIAGLPSYLLNTPAKNVTAQSTPPRIHDDSTINLSDLERSLPKGSDVQGEDAYKPEKLSFQSSEILARSSSIGGRLCPELTNEDFASTCQALFDIVKASDNSVIELCERNSKLGLSTERLQLPIADVSSVRDSCASFEQQDSFFAQLHDELFTSAEFASEKLLKDELSWRREKGSLPIHTNHSKFGEGDGDVSLKSKLDGDISIGEFFKRKTQAVDELNLQSSPERTRAPVPLVNVTTSTVADPKEEGAPMARPSAPHGLDGSGAASLEQLVHLSNSTIMNATQIAEILSKMDLEDTPARIMDYLMKNVAPPSTRPNNKSQSSDNSTLKAAQQSSTLTDSSRTFVVEPGSNASMKENSPRTKRYSAGPSPSPRPHPTPTKSILKDTSNSLDKYVAQNQMNAKTEKTEWTDMKQEIGRPASGENTLSSIVTDSPSYTCSELEFSEDERTDSAASAIHSLPTKWIEVLEGQPAGRSVHVGVPCELQVRVGSAVNRWLLVRLRLKGVQHSGGSSCPLQVELPTEEVLLKAVGAEHTFRFQATALRPGRIEAVLLAEAADMVGKSQMALEHVVVLDATTLDLQVSAELLNFGLAPENVMKRLPLVVNNLSKSDLKLELIIEQDIEVVYVFGTAAELSEPPSSELVVRKCCVLPKGRSLTLHVDMNTPALAEIACADSVCELKGKLLIGVGEKGARTPIREVPLLGNVGLTKMQFRATCLPLVLTAGESKPLQMKNSGVVQMDLAVAVFDAATNEPDPAFTLDQARISLKPNQSGCISIAYTGPKGAVSAVLRRCVRLRHVDYVGVNFLCEVEVHPPKSSKSVMLVLPKTSGTRRDRDHRPAAGSPVPDARLAAQPPRPASQNSDASSATAKYLQDGKLPIETTRAELAWGCVKLGKTVAQDFILRNRHSQKIRLQACVAGKDFKIVKDQSESVSSLLLALHGMESRTITVLFAPTAGGACTDRLQFLPMEVAEEDGAPVKRQRIGLFGYGGHALLAIQNVAKEPSGKMWLSFGSLECAGPLHQSFVLRNVGSLAAFALLSVRCKALYPFMDSSVKISPSEVVVAPRQEVTVHVSFTPRREDFKYLHSAHAAADVSEIASVQIVSGPEPSRGRIRRLFGKLQQQLGNAPYVTADLRLAKLSATLPHEHMPADLALCKESAAALRDLMRDLETREVVLTVERTDADRHGLASVLATDDTCMFQSVCNETTIATLDCTHSAAEAQAQARRRASGGFCTVEPRKLLLTPPVKPADHVLLSSRHSRPMPFEVSSASGDIQVEPRAGVVPPADTAVIRVRYARGPPEGVQLHRLLVYVENEMMEVEVKVVSVKAQCLCP